jgi:glycosyltransferase involved in cell wall biosynthesis
VRWCRADPNVEYMKTVGIGASQGLVDVSILLGPNPFRRSFCLSLIEAMWMEVFCISTNRAAISETAGGYGLLAPVLDPSSDEKFSAVDVESFLELVVESLSNYQALSRTLGLQKRYVSTSFNPNEAARQWRSALDAWLR